LLGKQQEDYVRIINHELSRLERLIIDFLDVSKFQSRKFKLNLKPFDILLNLKNTIEAFRVEAEKKNINLVLDVPQVSMIQVQADTIQIDRVISNLVENGIKYGSAGGEVKVKLSIQKEDVLVQVQDTGKGISKEHLQHVFKPFYRITNDHSGSGLGLPISKSIIKAHKGELWVESEPGKGTTFSFTLPRLHTDLNLI
jgi:signal transduction histidine kinase